jgi:hypothetical protein
MAAGSMSLAARRWDDRLIPLLIFDRLAQGGHIVQTCT